MRSGPNAITTDPLDLVVVVELMFLFGEQARRQSTDEPLVITPLSVLERLRELGVRSGNGSRLIGRDGVYESFSRLRAKGYIRRIQLRKGNKAAGVAYEFYDFPAWNPEPMAPQTESAFPQVGATSGIAGSGNPGSRSGNRASRSSLQVKAASGIAGSGNPGSRSPDPAFPQVGATSGNAGSPPHPPEEVTTSSPYPLTDIDGRGSLPSQKMEEGEEVRFAEEDLKAAADVFQLLPDPWTQGRVNAGKLAPKLLAVMAVQGWPGIHALDAAGRQLLTKQLTKNPHKVTNPYRLLAGDRVPNLPRYEVVAAAGARGPSGSSSADAMCADHPARYRTGCLDCAMTVPV
ncbi:hypothetical protein [Streptomyces sp. NPDC059129]